MKNADKRAEKTGQSMMLIASYGTLAVIGLIIFLANKNVDTTVFSSFLSTLIGTFALYKSGWG